MPHGPSDDELYDASLTMQDHLYAMADATGEMEAVAAAVNARLRHVNTVTSLDHDKIGELVTRWQEVALKVAHSEGANSELDGAESRLSQWHGDAKTALVQKMSQLRSHLDLTALVAVEATRSVAALYAFTVQARSSLLKLCKETTQVAVREIEDEEKRDTKLTLASVKEVINTVLSAQPGDVVRGTLNGIVNLTVVAVDRGVGGEQRRFGGGLVPAQCRPPDAVVRRGVAGPDSEDPQGRGPVRLGSGQRPRLRTHA